MNQQEAQVMLQSLAEAYGSPVPDLHVTEEVAPGYMGVFLIDEWSIHVRPHALTERVILHEYAHSFFHHLYPGVCEGMGSPGYEQCESFARQMERTVNGLSSVESLTFILGPITLGLALLFR